MKKYWVYLKGAETPVGVDAKSYSLFDGYIIFRKSEYEFNNWDGIKPDDQIFQMIEVQGFTVGVYRFLCKRVIRSTDQRVVSIALPVWQRNGGRKLVYCWSPTVVPARPVYARRWPLISEISTY